jgi:hypothetical protein
LGMVKQEENDQNAGGKGERECIGKA